VDWRLLVPASLLIDSLSGDPERDAIDLILSIFHSKARGSASLPRRASLHFEVHAFCLPPCLSRKVLASIACTRHSRYTPIPSSTHIPLPSSQSWLPISKPLLASSRPVSTRSRADRVCCKRITYIIDPCLTSIPAEQALKAQESTPGFSLALLQIVNTDSFPQATRLAAALFFKNFVRRNWVVRVGQTSHGGVD
jgi:hypothetical protein